MELSVGALSAVSPISFGFWMNLNFKYILSGLRNLNLVQCYKILMKLYRSMFDEWKNKKSFGVNTSIFIESFDSVVPSWPSKYRNTIREIFTTVCENRMRLVYKKSIQINVSTQYSITIQPAFLSIISIHWSDVRFVLFEWTTNLLSVFFLPFFYRKKAHYFSLLNWCTLPNGHESSSHSSLSK